MVIENRKSLVSNVDQSTKISQNIDRMKVKKKKRNKKEENWYKKRNKKKDRSTMTITASVSLQQVQSTTSRLVYEKSYQRRLSTVGVINGRHGGLSRRDINDVASTSTKKTFNDAIEVYSGFLA